MLEGGIIAKLLNEKWSTCAQGILHEAAHGSYPFRRST
jgi:hypothetical protein